MHWLKRKRTEHIPIHKPSTTFPSPLRCLAQSQNREFTEEENPYLCLLKLDNDHRCHYLPTPNRSEISTNHLYNSIGCKEVSHSYQPLRRHKSSPRNKPPQNYKATPNIPDRGDKHPVSTTVNTLRNLYACSICHKVFSTGQALGGHKRCHHERKNGGSVLTKSISQFRCVSSTLPKEQSNHDLIDLNLPPLPEISFNTTPSLMKETIYFLHELFSLKGRFKSFTTL
ncbi:unnamed protein product [Eruca vesicaria subsp. sativa]|uniref:C2H2-type domain-containing protein n=1 Tax=Eruca vesicaria subsp. sativa TaxID=29727 RepID=A0ABC8LS30_ERUVS|nr:unnamed protein product [Eruca vesicaria subsp. sativa]